MGIMKLLLMKSRGLITKSVRERDNMLIFGIKKVRKNSWQRRDQRGAKRIKKMIRKKMTISKMKVNQIHPTRKMP